MDSQCHVEPVQKSATAEELQTVKELTLVVWGMGCPNCAMRVRNGLVALRGVVRADVDHLTGMTNVAFNPTLLSVTDLEDAVERAGDAARHHYGVFSVIDRQYGESLSN